MKLTSIIILTINRLDMLEKCLDSIYKHTSNYELVIIGNNPTDEVRKYLNELNKFDLKLMMNKKNKGFPYACNQGIKLASYDWLCFINDDTVVTPGWLLKLQKCFEVKKDCGISSPTTCCSSGIQCDRSITKDRYTMSEPEILDYASKLKEEYIQTEVFGFCLLTKKRILEKVGVFDWKRYGLGSAEEADLQWRMRKFGYESYWAKASYVHHYHHATLDKLKGDFMDRYRKNRLIFEERKKDENLFIENDAKIGDIKEYKVKPVNEIVVCTAITNNKDFLMEKQVTEGADFICYTDDDNLKSNTWEIRKACNLFIDPNRNAKIHKILVHKYLSEYKYIVWMDGNINLEVPAKILVEEYLEDNNIALFRHTTPRDCIYEEADICINLKLDSPDIIEEQVSHYAREGYPWHSGLLECPVILRKNCDKIREFNNFWWAEICRYSKRDQLSSNYSLYKLSLVPEKIEGDIVNNNYFKQFLHPRPIKNKNNTIETKEI